MQSHSNKIKVQYKIRLQSIIRVQKSVGNEWQLYQIPPMEEGAVVFRSRGLLPIQVLEGVFGLCMTGWLSLINQLRARHCVCYKKHHLLSLVLPNRGFLISWMRLLILAWWTLDIPWKGPPPTLIVVFLTNNKTRANILILPRMTFSPFKTF